MGQNALGQSDCKIFKFSIYISRKKNDEIAGLDEKGNTPLACPSTCYKDTCIVSYMPKTLYGVLLHLFLVHSLLITLFSYFPL